MAGAPRLRPLVLRAVALAGVLAVGLMAARSAPPPLPETWESPQGREHPLAGRLVRTADGAAVTPQALMADAADARFVLLGERHDNPDHHRLQAWVVGQMAAAGRRPAVAFEMLDADQAGALAGYLSQPGGNAEGLGAAVGWTARGWPDWAIYKPIAEAALAARLPLRPADVAPATQRAVGREGWAALSPARRRKLALDVPLGGDLERRLHDDLKAAHCDMLPDEALPAMARVQRLRDATMADSLIAAAKVHDGAVLIAGRGHVRADRGVPWYLRARLETPKVLTLGIFEVRAGAHDPMAYPPKSVTAPAFDYLWFTPRGEDTDPCAGLRARG